MWICLNCEKNQHSHLRNKKTSKDAWDALKKVHGVQAKGRINLLLKRFHTYKAGPDESIDDIATALENIKLEIADIKETHEPQDSLVAIALMSAIEDPAYDTAKFLLERESDLTLEVAKESLKAVQQKLKDEKEEATENAHCTEAKSKGSIMKCHHCEKTSHTKTYCWDWLDNTEEGQEWERTHLEQKQKTKKAKSNLPKSNIANNPSRSINNRTSSNAANFSKSHGKSRGAARAANEDETDKDESKD